jgi:NAD(P)-dependent dehydrogenase (short-subunit alcohol dehydrogenase family)
MSDPGQPRLPDKVVIITGAADGLGRVMADLFSDHGAHLTLAGRRTQLLERAATELRDRGRRAIAVTTDVTDEAAVTSMVAATVAEYGRVDVMCNNAAQPGTDLHIWEQTVENWNNTIAVDVTAAMLCSREVLNQSMLEQGTGSIINFSSTAGLEGIPRKSHYCTAKAGLRALTKVVAKEVGPRGIRVNCIVPGGIQTDLLFRYWQRLAGEQGVSWEEIRDRGAKAAALRKTALPMEIAYAALFLASDESSAITGQSITVDCGTNMPG